LKKDAFGITTQNSRLEPQNEGLEDEFSGGSILAFQKILPVQQKSSESSHTCLEGSILLMKQKEIRPKVAAVDMRKDILFLSIGNFIGINQQILQYVLPIQNKSPLTFN